MIEVDGGNFTDIKHFTLQDIDYSHHFRFGFEDRSDLDAIIRKDRLVAESNSRRFSPDSLPHWFEPPEHAETFSNGDSDPLIVFLFVYPDFGLGQANGWAFGAGSFT